MTKTGGEQLIMGLLEIAMGHEDIKAETPDRYEETAVREMKRTTEEMRRDLDNSNTQPLSPLVTHRAPIPM